MVDYLDKIQIEQVKKHLAKTSNAERNTLLFMLGINLGLRSSDLIKLTLNKLKAYNLTQQKTGKSVHIIVPPELLETTINYCGKFEIGADDPLFTTFIRRNGKLRKTRKVITYEAFKWLLSQIGNKIGVNLKTHSLRKTFGRVLYQETNDIAIVAAFLGHKDIKSTLHYVGLTGELMDSVRSKIGVIG